jgi:hypothetical protein
MNRHNPSAIVLLIALFIGSVPWAASTAQAATTLEQGIRRETALLVAERDALRRERERVDVEHDARAAALRATVAALEARLVEATAREEAVRAALQARASTGGAATPAASPSTATMHGVFAAIGVAVPPVSAGTDPTVALLPLAVERLQARAAPQTSESGFFDADGAWVQGRVTRWGNAAWAAAGAPGGPAGALLPAVDGARQLATGDATANAAARAFVGGEKPALLPLALGAGAAQEQDGPTVVAGFGERLARLGVDGVVLLGILLLSFVVAWVPLARLLRQHQAVAAVAGRLPSLVRSGEVQAAAALACTVPGAAGAFLRSVVAATTRAHAEDEIAALSAEAGIAFERANHAARLGAVATMATVVVVTARSLSSAIAGLIGREDVPVRAVLDALAGAVLPVEIGALVAVPWAVTLIVVAAVVVRARERLDVLALRTLDALDRDVVGEQRWTR